MAGHTESEEDLMESRSSWVIEIPVDDVRTPAARPARLGARRANQKAKAPDNVEDDASSC